MLIMGATISLPLPRELRLGVEHCGKKVYPNHLALEKYYRSTDLILLFIYFQAREEREAT